MALAFAANRDRFRKLINAALAKAVKNMLEETRRPTVRVETRKQHGLARVYEVWIVSGCQSFRLDYRGTKREATWYARMLRQALQANPGPNRARIAQEATGQATTDSRLSQIAR